MRLTALGIEPVRVGRNLAEQVQRMSREPRLVRRGFQRAVPETPRVVETTERQRGSTQPRIEPSEIADVSGRDLTLDKLLTFPKPAQCLARIAELRQVPGGEDDRQGKQEGEVPRPGHRNRMLEPLARLRPLASQQVDRAIGEVIQAGNL